MVRAACLLAACVCAAAGPLAAQHAQDDRQALQRAPGWGAWGGIARNSPGNLWGAEMGRDVELFAIRMVWPLARSQRFAVDYVMDAVPAARVSMVRDDGGIPRCSVAKPGEVCVNIPLVSDTRPVMGFGIAPLGVQLRHRSGRHVQAYADLSGGVLRFAREMPLDGAARLNFTAEIGAGVLIGRPGRLGASIGYKFYHISNAGTAPYNPGLDNHMLVVGVQRIFAF